MKKIAAIVLGSLYCSPRMLNHMTSFAEITKLRVYFVDNKRSSMTKKLDNYGDQINLVYILNVLIYMIKGLPHIFYLLYAIMLIVYQIMHTLEIFLSVRYYVLVQNPPYIPLYHVLIIHK